MLLKYYKGQGYRTIATLSYPHGISISRIVQNTHAFGNCTLHRLFDNSRWITFYICC
jgi:hypothetical protein